MISLSFKLFVVGHRKSLVQARSSPSCFLLSGDSGVDLLFLYLTFIFLEFWGSGSSGDAGINSIKYQNLSIDLSIFRSKSEY